jgi:aldehyde dehydrogenase (NAD+)
MDERAALLRPGLLIGDEWRTTGSGGELEHVNPSTGKRQAMFPIAGPTEIDDAVGAARAALASWRRTAPVARRAVLNRIGELIREHADDLATINALEVGTPAALSRLRYTAGITAFEYHAGWVDRLTGDTIPMTPGQAFDFTVLEPVGVVAAILTWNHPLANIQMVVAPALAAGCSVVIKPPEAAPFACLRFGQLCEEAGLPPGVVNVVPGGPDAGDALVRHPGVDKISFVGGGAIGARIQAAAAESLTPLVLELGGKSAAIVFPDANLDTTVRFAVGVTGNSGQGCTIPSRLLVHDDVYDQVVDRLLPALAAVKVGDPFEEDTLMGPVISESACMRILEMVERARDTGAGTLLCGGERLGGSLADGWFLPPTVFGEVDPESELAQEEVFGPVLAVTRFTEEDEAIALANGTRYGLAAYLITQDIDRALRVASELDAGNIGINGAGAPAGWSAPSGGVKDSGYGKVGGREGIMEYIRTKNVLVALS